VARFWTCVQRPDFGYIQKLGMDGITLGCGGGNFCPGGTVARDKMATFLAKANSQATMVRRGTIEGQT
jgi:hypothetical protein